MATEQFELKDFLPYLLNQSAEVSSLGFQQIYKDRYGMLRAEWRVLFHLGLYGRMTAGEICDRARMHKTKISRAVQRLAERRYLVRERSADDRRQEFLQLTQAGQAVYDDLLDVAKSYDKDLRAQLTAEEAKILVSVLRKLGQISD